MSSGLSTERLARMRAIMAGHVESGEVPGLVTVVARHGDVHVEALGTHESGGAGRPMAADTIFRIASISKQITAVAAMILVEECRLRLDDPVDDLLPELAGRRVLRGIDRPLDDTVPANRPITLRDLLTLRMGLGAVMAPPGTYPIQRAIEEAGLFAGAGDPGIEPDEWMKRLGSLPLVHQPGEQWMYHTASDVVGVLLARATGMPLERFLTERLLEPLGMKDTAFHVPAAKLDRLPTAYDADPVTGALVVADDPRHGRWAHPPAFPSAGGGLVSTAGDLLAFCTMMLNMGRYGDARILARPTVELMITDQLTERQRADNAMFLDGNSGWGLGVNVITLRTAIDAVPGRFGWTGGTGTSVYTDPAEAMIGILLTQRSMGSPVPPAVFRDFWTAAYQAIDD